MSEDAKRWVGLAVLVLMVGFAGWFVVFGRGGDGGSGSGGRAGGEPTSSATGAAAPSQDPATTPEPTPTPTPTGPIPPPRPADELSDAGAAAFMQYWMDALNWSTETMDADPLEQASAASCGQCELITSETRADAAAGRRYEGGINSVRNISVEPIGSGADPTVRRGVVLIDGAAFTKFNSDGSIFRADAPEQGVQFSFTIEFMNNRSWFATSLYLFKNA